MAKVKITLWNGQQNADKTYPLYLRVYKDRRVKLVSIGYSVYKKDWDGKAGKVLPSNKNYARLNNLFSRLLLDAQSTALEIEAVDFTSTAKQIVTRIKGAPNKDYFAFAYDWIKQFDSEWQRGTYLIYVTQLAKLKRYLNNQSLSFKDIDPTFLRRYETYLKSIGNRTKTIHGNLKRIRAVYYAAIREGITEQAKNPFFSFKLKVEKTKKERLTIEELNKIRQVDLNRDTNVWHCKKMFLLSFNCMGMRISDVLLLTWGNIKTDRLEYKMKKTKEIKSIILSQEAKQILALYRDRNEKVTENIFPILKTGDKPLYDRLKNAIALVNKSLKELAVRAGINKSLSTHVARHTWALRAKDLSINLKTIQKGLGHENVRTTEIYLADFNDNDIDEANAKITSEGTLRSADAKTPKLAMCASPQVCMRIPLLGLQVRSSAIMAAAPRKKAKGELNILAYRMGTKAGKRVLACFSSMLTGLLRLELGLNSPSFARGSFARNALPCSIRSSMLGTFDRK
jgi:site-specific recombinase XerD